MPGVGRFTSPGPVKGGGGGPGGIGGGCPPPWLSAVALTQSIRPAVTIHFPIRSSPMDFILIPRSRDRVIALRSPTP